ncbi:SUMF1/EgtB/PvdO family nonheme iron enzyme [Streptomyces sp. JV176]|uniref:formylglycine-generating enzyme family protein n=1 Tax=Streptomyces sp. JV176 TaxID=858630 RepID=UPI002E76E862|nr:SUMF1/EgtB/PvdO family nonheme iron enzyme [Streptomyces sp. JV176]MEE1802523.1 SUMF1/EgtB/PvdO family nonheme iron enzyme [Streptomyces sp. JV176]
MTPPETTTPPTPPAASPSPPATPPAPHFAAHAELADPALLHPDRDSAERLRALTPAELAAAVEDPAEPLAVRLAAGGLLALLGDPRIRTGAAPATRAVAGGAVHIGLPPRDVAAVVDAWAHVGVERAWIEKETPVEQVALADYWISTYPVTNAEYRHFLADTRHTARPTTWYLGAYPYDRANHPVAGVRPEDADAYAAWLSERTGHPWRLPGEAEWEYAAKGPLGFAFPWGDRFDADAANTRETGVHTTTPVGAFPAGRSPFGVSDMGGNVEEFVADDYRPYWGGSFVTDDLSAGTDGSPGLDRPAGADDASRTDGARVPYRVARGGSFSRFGDLARTRRRHGAFPSPLYPVGFRLATGTRP